MFLVETPSMEHLRRWSRPVLESAPKNVARRLEVAPGLRRRAVLKGGERSCKVVPRKRSLRSELW